jgi:hypothetical protein
MRRPRRSGERGQVRAAKGRFDRASVFASGAESPNDVAAAIRRIAPRVDGAGPVTRGVYL